MKRLIYIVFIVLILLALVITFIYFKNKRPVENIYNADIKTVILKEGDEAVNGSKISVNYTGWLVDGTKFDSSLDPNRRPLEFTLGKKEVIEGWEKGVLGMKVGEIRRIEIPASMAYGEQDLGIIPPNSDLIFEVELLNVEK
jgi:FKBP-type peptidyl-prolyl cis-trans isomerase